MVCCYACNCCRNLPLSIVISISAIIVLYVFANFTYFVVLGIDGVLQSEAVAVVRCITFSCMHIIICMYVCNVYARVYYVCMYIPYVNL